MHLCDDNGDASSSLRGSTSTLYSNASIYLASIQLIFYA